MFDVAPLLGFIRKCAAPTMLFFCAVVLDLIDYSAKLQVVCVANLFQLLDSSPFEPVPWAIWCL